MRFVSLCAVLGAALLPVASAGPCKPKTTSVVTTTTAGTETLSTDTETKTDTQSIVTSDATSLLETTLTGTETTDLTLETTVTETAIETDTATTDLTSTFDSAITNTATELATETTAATDVTTVESTLTESVTLSETTTFVSDYTTEYTATTDTTSIEDITTTVTEDVPEPTINLVSNGGFEDGDDGEWGVRTVELVKDSRAKSGERMVFFKVNEQLAVGGNHLNQTIIDLSTANLYRLSFEGAVFGTYDFKDSTCSMEALVSGQIIKGWELKDFVVDRYQTYSTDFSPFYPNFELTLRLRCLGGDLVTVSFGVDDVFLGDLGPKPQAPPVDPVDT
ncbi:hypothetical protein NW752_007562 [Fusarium irregulare]|uniref:CBM-cenC domain-containing protein n=1 Tax=Fusarium irregulare TaxID=2494466 RepID=A0A9W8U722_9HYPO|nr:hypothetical protein NW766_010142 [Fusarium irregulare]KAJ4013267.1 hypothetical protein NW752_007562 [Fusarium irregulare]